MGGIWSVYKSVGRVLANVGKLVLNFAIVKDSFVYTHSGMLLLIRHIRKYHFLRKIVRNRRPSIDSMHSLVGGGMTINLLFHIR